MFRATTAGVLAVGSLLSCGGGSSPQSPSSSPSSGTLVWQDDFDGQGLPDASRWNYEVGLVRNNERQYYTQSRSENARLEGGRLVIEARKESFQGASYTSASLTSRANWTYARIEVRAKLPKGRGTWPAIWTLGTNIGQVGWPTCGEIDIMENIGREPNIVHGTLHGPGYSGGQGPTASFTGPTPFADDFHVFAIEWEPATIRWYVDGNLYSTRNASDLPGGARWVFDHGFFILLNVAVGGDWPGNPDDTTALPQEMVVDWLRVYKR